MKPEKWIIDNFILFFTSDDKEREQMRAQLEIYLEEELEVETIFTYDTEDVMDSIRPYEEDEPQLAQYLKEHLDEIVESIRNDDYMHEHIDGEISDIVHQHVREYRRLHPEEQQVTAT